MTTFDKCTQHKHNQQKAIIKIAKWKIGKIKQ